jgi:hypothetical protein
METGKIVKMMVLAIGFAVVGNAVPAAAAGKKEVIINFGNGTGGAITALQISPAKAKYPGNGDCMGFQGLNVKDGETFAMVLPEQLKGMDTFDIELISGGKRYVSPARGVAINLANGKIPTLELSRNGRSSTRANIGAAVGGVGGVGAVATTATALWTGTVMLGQAVGAAAITEALTVAGGIVGGGMLAGVGVVAAIPVALGVGGFFIGRALTPRGLAVQVYYN